MKLNSNRRWGVGEGGGAKEEASFREPLASYDSEKEKQGKGTLEAPLLLGTTWQFNITHALFSIIKLFFF